MRAMPPWGGHDLNCVCKFCEYHRGCKVMRLAAQGLTPAYTQHDLWKQAVDRAYRDGGETEVLIACTQLDLLEHYTDALVYAKAQYDIRRKYGRK
jgi:hypothetical protein